MVRWCGSFAAVSAVLVLGAAACGNGDSNELRVLQTRAADLETRISTLNTTTAPTLPSTDTAAPTTPESTNTPIPTSTPAPTPDRTATATVLESYKESPPPGEFRHTGAITVVIWEVQYLRNIGSFYADSNSKFIVLNVSVGVSSRLDATFFGSTQFTLVSTAGHTVDVDSSTYRFNAPFPSLTVQPGDSTGGMLAFLVVKDFVPERLVWNGFRDTLTVQIVED